MILISQKFFNMFQPMKVHHHKSDAECMHYGIMLFPNIYGIAANQDRTLKMVEDTNGYVTQSGVLLQDSSSYINENCVNCTLMNGIYQEVFMELKSLRLITNILHGKSKP